MVVIDMNPMPPRVIGKKPYLQTRVFQGYQRTLDIRSVQTLEGKKSQKEQGIL